MCLWSPWSSLTAPNFEKFSNFGDHQTTWRRRLNHFFVGTISHNVSSRKGDPIQCQIGLICPLQDNLNLRPRHPRWQIAAVGVRIVESMVVEPFFDSKPLIMTKFWRLGMNFSSALILSFLGQRTGRFPRQDWQPWPSSWPLSILPGICSEHPFQLLSDANARFLEISRISPWLCTFSPSRFDVARTTAGKRGFRDGLWRIFWLHSCSRFWAILGTQGNLWSTRTTSIGFQTQNLCHLRMGIRCKVNYLYFVECFYVIVERRTKKGRTISIKDRGKKWKKVYWRFYELSLEFEILDRRWCNERCPTRNQVFKACPLFKSFSLGA